MSENDPSLFFAILSYCIETEAPLAERCEIPPLVWQSNWNERRRLSEVVLTDDAIRAGYRITGVVRDSVTLFDGKADSVKFFSVELEQRQPLTVTVKRFERLAIPGRHQSGDEIVGDSCDCCGARFKTKRRFKSGLCADCSFEAANAGPSGSEHACRICKNAISLMLGPEPDLCFDCYTKLKACDLCGKTPSQGLLAGICSDCLVVIQQDDLASADGECRHCKAPIPYGPGCNEFCLACSTVQQERGAT